MKNKITRRSKASFVLEVIVIFIFLLRRQFGQEAVFPIHLHYKEQKARGYYFRFKHSFYMKMRSQLHCSKYKWEMASKFDHILTSWWLRGSKLTYNGNWRTKWDWKQKIYIQSIFHTIKSFMVTALTQFHHFSPYCHVTGNLVVKIAHSPVTTEQWMIEC